MTTSVHLINKFNSYKQVEGLHHFLIDLCYIVFVLVSVLLGIIRVGRGSTFNHLRINYLSLICVAGSAKRSQWLLYIRWACISYSLHKFGV